MSKNINNQLKVNKYQEKKHKTTLLMPSEHHNQRSFLNSSIKVYFPMQAQMFEVMLELGSEALVSDAVSSAINYFSKDQEIDCNLNNYELYISKKNGQPKFDYPAFQSKQLISKTNTTVFTLCHCNFDQNIGNPILHVLKNRSTGCSLQDEKSNNNLYESPLKERNFVIKTKVDSVKKKKRETWFSFFMLCRCGTEEI